MEVTTFARTPKPYLNADLIEELGARYISTKETSVLEAAKQYGPFDLVFEGTGNSSVVFDSMQALGKNGVLVLASVTGGDKMIQIPADRINLEFVLGNKVMVGTVNANREYFEMGVKHFCIGNDVSVLFNWFRDCGTAMNQLLKRDPPATGPRVTSGYPTDSRG